mgnify:CR=1 FL=1
MFFQNFSPYYFIEAKYKVLLVTTYSPTLRGGSTIGASGLNFSVRNGKRCITQAIVTKIFNKIKKIERDEPIN